MKKVLFAIAGEGMKTDKIQMLETQICEALKSGSREYADLNMSYHCDHKEALLRMCIQNNVDVLVVNENLQGQGDLISILKDVKSELPAVLIVLLLTSNRNVGDVFLANAVASGIYNWVVAPWGKVNIANVIISPKKLKDVEMYMPKIVEGKDGLAFDTVVVEKKKEELTDLPDILGTKVNNGVSADNVNDVNEERQTHSVGYSRKMNGGKFRFGKVVKLKPINNKVEEPEVVAETEKTSEVPNEPLVQSQSITNEVSPVVQKAVQDTTKTSSNELSNFNDFIKQREVQKEPVRPFGNNINDDVPPRTIEERKPFSGIESKFQKVEKVEEYNPISKTEEPAKKLVPSNFTREETVSPEIKAEDIKKAHIQAPVFKVSKLMKPDNEKTLQGIEFKPKYNRVLFIRALPIASAIPVHIAKLSRCTFVDLNKNDNSNIGFLPDTVKTTIKECNLPEGPIVADVIAGNGVEKLIDKFDLVVVILPEDLNVIKDFMKRYSFFEKCGVIVDKCITGVLPVSVLRKTITNCEFLNTVKIETVAKTLFKAMEQKELLLDNPDYYTALKWVVKDLGE